jgi:hypothetical protein
MAAPENNKKIFWKTEERAVIATPKVDRIKAGTSPGNSK